jgi:hypothetical protein
MRNEAQRGGDKDRRQERKEAAVIGSHERLNNPVERNLTARERSA